jgi:hypothetical protein
VHTSSNNAARAAMENGMGAWKAGTLHVMAITTPRTPGRWPRISNRDEWRSRAGGAPPPPPPPPPPPRARPPPPPPPPGGLAGSSGQRLQDCSSISHKRIVLAGSGIRQLHMHACGCRFNWSCTGRRRASSRHRPPATHSRRSSPRPSLSHTDRTCGHTSTCSACTHPTQEVGFTRAHTCTGTQPLARQRGSRSSCAQGRCGSGTRKGEPIGQCSEEAAGGCQASPSQRQSL